MYRLSAAIMLFASVASAAAPNVTLLFPPGGQRGTKLEVSCEGEFPWPLQVSAPGVDAVPTATNGKIQVTIPADLPADRVWFRFYNQEGASELRPFLIGNLSEVMEHEPNQSSPHAQEVAVPTTINGRLDAMDDVDCYAVHLTAGQTLVAAVEAHHRLGSPMDGILQIVTPDGFILAENHDDIRFDPVATLHVPKTGKYIIRLAAFASDKATSSIRFHGNKETVYRLTLTSGPRIMNAIPNVLPLNELHPVRPVGWNVPQDTRLPAVQLGSGRLTGHEEFESSSEVRIPAGSHIATVTTPDMSGSATVRIWPHRVVNHAERDAASGPLTLELPVAVSGGLRSPDQADIFHLPLTKGDSVVITVESNRVDSILDPLVTVEDPTGAPVPDALHAAVPKRDTVIAFTATVDGQHRLTVRDPYRMDSSRRYYRLSAWLEQPDFEVSLATDAIVIVPGKPFELPLSIVRRGNAMESVGAIALRVLGLPDGATAPDVVSAPTGDTSGAVKMVITASGIPFSGRLRIRATAESPRPIERYARTPERLGATFESIWATITP